MQRFVELNTSEEMFNMVFVDSIDEYYWGEDGARPPIIEQPSSTESPFKGRSPHECYLLLRRLVKDTESRVNWQEFVIVDEQSLQVSNHFALGMVAEVADMRVDPQSLSQVSSRNQSHSALSKKLHSLKALKSSSLGRVRQVARRLKISGHLVQ